MVTVSIATADGLSLYSPRHTRPRFWWIGYYSGFDWLRSRLSPPKLSPAALYTPEELADAVWKGVERDHGRHWLLWMGEDYEKVKAMSDEELRAVSREVSSWPTKEPTHCDECGQTLTTDA